ncbi:MAG: cytochrome c [Gemmatimonadales bacterium]
MSDPPIRPAEPAVDGTIEPDVERIHRPIFREPPDPEEGREPAPWWLWIASAIVLFWGGWYLGRYGGTFGTATHVAFGEPSELAREEAAEAEAAALADPVAAGENIYARQCQPCHQTTGDGMPGAFPPLRGSEWVTGEPEIVARILLGGLQGPISVAGRTFDGVMPAWRDVLSDAEIAAVATYIRQWTPNDAPPVDPAIVAGVREETAERGATPWSVDELREVTESSP